MIPQLAWMLWKKEISQDLRLTPYVVIFSEDTNMYLHIMSFLNNGITQVVEILLHVRQGPTYSTIANIMGADVLAAQGAITRNNADQL